MNKEALVARFAEKTGLSKKEATEKADALFDSMIEGLKEDGILDIYKILKAEVKPTKARTGRNPQSGEEISIPEGKKISIKPLKMLKDIVGK